jgi:hypothetical protein
MLGTVVNETIDRLLEVSVELGESDGSLAEGDEGDLDLDGSMEQDEASNRLVPRSPPFALRRLPPKGERWTPPVEGEKREFRFLPFCIEGGEENVPLAGCGTEEVQIQSMTLRCANLPTGWIQIVGFRALLSSDPTVKAFVKALRVGTEGDSLFLAKGWTDLSEFVRNPNGIEGLPRLRRFPTLYVKDGVVSGGGNFDAVYVDAFAWGEGQALCRMDLVVEILDSSIESEPPLPSWEGENL